MTTGVEERNFLTRQVCSADQTIGNEHWQNVSGAGVLCYESARCGVQAQAPSGTARIGAAALVLARLQCCSSGRCYELVSFAGCRAESRATRHKNGTEHADRARWQSRRRKLSLSRNIKCDTCRGSGTKSGRRYTCEQCHGSGVTVRSLLPQCRQHAWSDVMLQARCRHASASAKACADHHISAPFLTNQNSAVHNRSSCGHWGQA